MGLLRKPLKVMKRIQTTNGCGQLIGYIKENIGSGTEILKVRNKDIFRIRKYVIHQELRASRRKKIETLLTCYIDVNYYSLYI